MSKSFALVNGDLRVGAGSSYQTVSGQTKLIQDLTLWIKEKIGHDPMTPTYGSRFDGGIIDGQEITSFIGQVVSLDLLNQIRNETQDLLTRYQTMQLDKIRAEALRYGGRNTLDPDEVLSAIDSLQVKNITDTVVVQVKITTLAGTKLALTIPIAQGA